MSTRGGGASENEDRDRTLELELESWESGSASESESCQAAQARLSLALASLRRLPDGGGWLGDEHPPPPRGAAELGTLPLPPRLASDLRGRIKSIHPIRDCLIIEYPVHNLGRPLSPHRVEP